MSLRRSGIGSLDPGAEWDIQLQKILDGILFHVGRRLIRA